MWVTKFIVGGLLAAGSAHTAKTEAVSAKKMLRSEARIGAQARKAEGKHMDMHGASSNSHSASRRAGLLLHEVRHRADADQLQPRSTMSGLHSCRGQACFEPASAVDISKTAVALTSLMRLTRVVPVIRNMFDLRRIAFAIATQDRELMFTTVTMDRGLFQLVFLRQWQGNLRSAAAHALLIGADNRTCLVALNASIPCFVDGLAPVLSGRQNQFGSQVRLTHSMVAAALQTLTAAWWSIGDFAGLVEMVVCSSAAGSRRLDNLLRP